MSLLDYFRFNRQQQQSSNSSAAVAKERLQILVAHEHSRKRNSPDYLPALKKDLLEAIRKYVPISQEQVKIHLDREGAYEILELNITLPDEEGPP